MIFTSRRYVIDRIAYECNCGVCSAPLDTNDTAYEVLDENGIELDAGICPRCIDEIVERYNLIDKIVERCNLNHRRGK